MRKFVIFVLCSLSASLAMAPPGQAPTTASSSLAAFMPLGPLLYLESPDFGTLVRDWNNSQEKPKWLVSDNYKVFSRSRLFLRLQEAQRQFGMAAGAPPDMGLVDSVAGGQSALAIYDIGNLEFLYVTRMPSARAMQNALWTNREKFEPRKAADVPYYVQTEPEKNRLVAFATMGDYLVLATREDLMAGALGLLSGKSQPRLPDEVWYKSAVAAAGPAGDLRMVLNLAALVKSPHFRSYWIERNVTELKQFSAEVADVHRSETEIREDRVLLKTNPPPEAEPRGAAVGELLSMLPLQEGLYRAWRNPTVEMVLGLVQEKVLTPRSGPGVPSPIAPAVSSTPGQAGSESDLETRIDVAPLQGRTGALGVEPLTQLLNRAPLEAVLEFHSLRHAGSPAFVEPHTAILIRSSADWDSQAVRDTLRAAVRDLWSTSQIGVNWVENREANAGYFHFDGLVPLALAVRGPVLLLANSDETLRSLLVRTAPGQATNPPVAAQGQNLVYAAGFHHAAERVSIVAMMRLIEMPAGQAGGVVPGQDGREPGFFSENLASFSRSLESIESESLIVEDRGPMLVQTATYRLKQK